MSHEIKSKEVAIWTCTLLPIVLVAKLYHLSVKMMVGSYINVSCELIYVNAESKVTREIGTLQFWPCDCPVLIHDGLFRQTASRYGDRLLEQQPYQVQWQQFAEHDSVVCGKIKYVM